MSQQPLQKEPLDFDEEMARLRKMVEPNRKQQQPENWDNEPGPLTHWKE